MQGTWITLCVCKSVYCHAIDSNEAEGWMNGFMDLFHEIGWRWRGGGGNLLLFTLHITFYATPPPDVVAPARVIGLASSVGFFYRPPPIDEAEDRTELTLRRPREGLDRLACRS